MGYEPALVTVPAIVACPLRACWTREVLSVELESPVTGVIWKVMAAVGTTVAPGDPVVVVESMKTEIMEVIGRYVEVDKSSADFRLQKEASGVSLISNIPVTRVTARAV